jgi:hypothetical protein
VEGFKIADINHVLDPKEAAEDSYSPWSPRTACIWSGAGIACFKTIYDIEEAGSEKLKVAAIKRAHKMKGLTALEKALTLAKEGETGIINLEDDHTEAVQELLYYIYALADSNGRLYDYSTIAILTSKQTASKEWWTRHVLVFGIADKYRMDRLRDLANTAMHKLLEEQDLFRVEGWELLIQAIYDLEQTGTEKLRLAAIGRVEKMKREVRGGGKANIKFTIRQLGVLQQCKKSRHCDWF